MRSPAVHLLLASLVCIATMVGYGFWYATVEAKSTEVALLENQIATKTATAGHIASARASLADIAGDEASMRSYFVPETGVVAFINSLEGQGKKQGTVVNVLSVSTTVVGARPALSFSLTVNGSFDAVMRMVGMIEYAPYDLSLTSLSVQQDGKSSWRADLNLLVGSSASVATSTTL